MRLPYAVAAMTALFVSLPASAQVAAPGDPFANDPTGIVADPCPQHDDAAWGSTTLETRIIHGLARDFGGLCVYRADDKRIATQATRPEAVFVGDSITYGWKEKDAAFFPRDRIVGRGIGGQTTPQMLLRFRDDVIALRPRVVHIMAGTNDVAGNTGPSTLDTVVGNIASMAELARAHGIRVIIASVPPAAKFGWRPDVTGVPETIAALNAKLKAYAREQGFTWVDYHPVLATQQGAMRPEFSPDGVHPNAAGYAAMDPLAKAAIASALASR